MGLPILGLVEAAKGIAGKIADTVQGKRELVASLATLEASLLSGAMDYEIRVLEAKKELVLAEANSQSWIARNWRPLAMLWLLALISAYWLGLVDAQHLTESLVERMFLAFQYGLGGYVVGRSAEKIARTVAPHISGMKLRRKKD